MQTSELGKTTVMSHTGKVLARSKNLRGVTDYARKLRVLGPTHLQAMDCTDGMGILIASYPDGASSATLFASFAVCKHWLAQRVRCGQGRFVTGT